MNSPNQSLVTLSLSKGNHPIPRPEASGRRGNHPIIKYAMKKLLTSILGIALYLASFAQAPQGFNYQAVIRDTEGQPLSEQQVSIRLTLQDEAGETIHYAETHVLTTSPQGVVSLVVGSGTPVEKTFADVPWEEGDVYLMVEVDPTGGKAYSLLGVTQLLSVPYALHAFRAEDLTGELNETDPVFTAWDKSTGIEITESQISDLQDYLTGETDPLLTASFDFTDAVEGDLLRHDGEKWVSVTPDFLTTLWQDGDNQVITEVKVGIGTDTPTEMLDVDGNIRARGRFMGEGMEVDPPESLPEEPIFVVRNSLGQIVMAVYEKGVRMYVEDDFVPGGKGNKSGFAIGGLTGFKQNDTEYFRVTPDSVRIFLREPTQKGNKGGFAIGGLTGLKADTVPLMFLAPDSTRFYIDTESSGKGNKSGFAIGGLTGFKSGAPVNFFNVSADTTATIDPSEARILWYPTKNAFMAGQVIIEDPDSVGTNSTATGYESKAVGGWSQAMGYKAISRGNYSTAIGKNAVANNENSFSFGDGAKALNEDAYAFGAFTEARGVGSFAFGYVGRDTLGPTGNITMANGDYSFAFGLGSRSVGESSFAMGAEVFAEAPFSFAFGYKSKALGWYSESHGSNSIATGNYSYANGFFAKAENQYSFAIGTVAEAKANYATALGPFARAYGERALALGHSVNATGSYSTAIGHQNTAEGSWSTSIGRYSHAKGENSFAIGYSAKTGVAGNKAISIGPYAEANGISSISLGISSNASGAYSVAIGSTSRANSYCATAIGDHADAYNRGSVAIGSGVQAYGRYSAVIGMNAYAHAHTSFVFGSYNEENIAYDSTAWVLTDPLFILANGTGYGSRSNALTVLKNGNMGIGITTPTEKLQVNGNATVTGTVTASEFIGDFSGDLEGNVTGNFTGAVNELTMGKINLTSSGIIASIYDGKFKLRWDHTTQTIYLENVSGGEFCHIWWQNQKGASSSGDSFVTDDPELLVDKNIVDGYGYQIHFGDAQGGTSYCSVWVQYSSTNQRLMGHYTKF